MATTPLPFPQESSGATGPAAPLPAGTAVAHLTIERVLHEGLHNVVYLARDPGGEPVALMEYFPRTLALRQPDGALRARQAGDAIALSVGREAFVQDANALERVQHAGLVRVLGSLQAHRTVYRAMGYLEGVTLERHITARGHAASVAAAVRLLDALLDALDVLHRAGVVHGCVRPDQILMLPGDRPVLLGMGSAGAEIAGHEAGPWSAPEQSAASRHDRTNSATDLYMAAATTWCYASGETPPALRERLADPDAWQPATALEQVPPHAGDGPGMRERLIAALTAALALLPSERPQRVADLRRLLHPGASGTPFEPSGTVPLWVGNMPDREEQWEVYEKEAVQGRQRPGAVPPAPSPAPMAANEAATDVLPRHMHAEVHEGSASPTPPAGIDWRRWWWMPALAVATVGVGGALWVGRDAPPAIKLEAPVAQPAPVVTAPVAAAPVAPPPAPAPAPVVAAPPAAPEAPVAAAPPPPRVAAPPPARPAPPPPARPAPAPAPAPVAVAKAKPAAPPSPRTACGNRSQFALLYCLQEQCNKAALRNHAQCNELRRRGDIQ